MDSLHDSKAFRVRHMSAEKLLALRQLFKNCLYLGDMTSVIEKSLEEMECLDFADVCEYLDKEAQLAPLLWWHLKQRSLTRRLEQRLAAYLECRYQENVARNFLFERRLEQILQDFNRHEVEVLVLKGASSFVGPLSVFRDAFVLSDMDLMVMPAELERATEILISSGYSLENSEAMCGGGKRGFLGADNVTLIDLHSALFWAGVGFNYLDSFPSDVWEASIPDSLGGNPVRVLSLEGQVCFRLAHDAIGHRTLLLSNIGRLYYFCLLIDFYRESIDWSQLLQKLKLSGTDRLLAAYAHYGKRELGLSLPPALQKYRRGVDDVAYLDAVTDASDRLADYSYRASVATLTTPSFPKRIQHVYESAVRDCVVRHLARKGAVARLRGLIVMFKTACLQILAVLYVSIHRSPPFDLGG